jgi:hypothetical protein
MLILSATPPGIAAVNVALSVWSGILTLTIVSVIPGPEPTGPASGRPDDRLREGARIHNHDRGLWIPGSRKGAPRNDADKRRQNQNSIGGA